MKEALVPDPQAWPCWMTLGWWSWWALASSVVLLFTNLLNFQVCFFANDHGMVAAVLMVLLAASGISLFLGFREFW